MRARSGEAVRLQTCADDDCVARRPRRRDHAPAEERFAATARTSSASAWRTRRKSITAALRDVQRPQLRRHVARSRAARPGRARVRRSTPFAARASLQLLESRQLDPARSRRSPCPERRMGSRRSRRTRAARRGLPGRASPSASRASSRRRHGRRRSCGRSGDGRARLLLEHGEARAGPTLEERTRCREAHEAAADDCVVRRRHVASGAREDEDPVPIAVGVRSRRGEDDAPDGGERRAGPPAGSSRSQGRTTARAPDHAGG